MARQRKELSAEAIEFVVCLKKHHDQECKAGKTVSTKGPAARTAAGLNIGVATVKRVMADYERKPEQKNKINMPVENCAAMRIILSHSECNLLIVNTKIESNSPAIKQMTENVVISMPV